DRARARRARRTLRAQRQEVHSVCGTTRILVDASLGIGSENEPLPGLLFRQSELLIVDKEERPVFQPGSYRSPYFEPKLVQHHLCALNAGQVAEVIVCVVGPL